LESGFGEIMIDVGATASSFFPNAPGAKLLTGSEDVFLHTKPSIFHHNGVSNSDRSRPIGLQHATDADFACRRRCE
jgi:hypothetical protein